MTLTAEQRQVLITVLKAKLLLWDLSREAEKVLGCELDVESESVGYLCAAFDSEDDVDSTEDSLLIEAFELA